MSQFKFHMHDQVSIKASSEQGSVVARAEYDNAENNYRVRYVGADGKATERWWTESALEAA